MTYPVAVKELNITFFLVYQLLFFLGVIQFSEFIAVPVERPVHPTIFSIRPENLFSSKNCTLHQPDIIRLNLSETYRNSKVSFYLWATVFCVKLVSFYAGLVFCRSSSVSLSPVSLDIATESDRRPF